MGMKDWTYRDAMKATTFVKGIMDFAAEATLMALVADEKFLNVDDAPNLTDDWLNGLSGAKWDDDEKQHFIDSVRAVMETARGLADILEQVLKAEDLLNPLPDPDTVVIPDTIEGIM